MRLYWIDCETTGLDPERDSVLEIAVSVAELERPFDATPVYHAVLAWDAPAFRLEPVVQAMHTKSGLLEECRQSMVDDSDVEDALLALVPEVADPEERPVIAGAGAHFDLGFLRADFPRLALRFSHRVYDVSAVKLFCRSLGMPKLPKGEAHRARPDVLEALAHGRECARWLARWGKRADLPAPRVVA